MTSVESMQDICPQCGRHFDWMRNFEQERAGQGFNHEFGQTEHWFAGTVTCPKCRASWQHGDSSL